MGLGHSPRIVTDGLVLCLDAANKRSYGGSGTTWTDLMGNNNATLYNAITFSEDNAGVFVTDQTDEFIRTDSQGVLTGTSAKSICGWFYYNYGGHVNIAGFGTYGNGQLFDIMVWTNGGYRRLITHHYGSGFDTISSLPTRDTLSYGAWNNFCVTYDSSVVKVYTNGEFSNQKTISINTQSNYLYIGRGVYTSYNSNPASRFGSVCCYNRALTADEVRQNYLATKERYA